MKILDFGCGEGHLVQAFNSLGYDAYGADVIDCPALDEEHFRKISFAPYRLPFEDNTFDYVYSTSVFEHVLNTEEALKEIYRVLKPGGVTVHSLPSRYRIIEPHIKVPFGGLIQSSGWLKLWAALGIRNEFQSGLPWREVYQRNTGFCKEGIHYLKYKELKEIIISVFGNVKIMNKEYAWVIKRDDSNFYVDNDFDFVWGIHNAHFYSQEEYDLCKENAELLSKKHCKPVKVEIKVVKE